MRTNGFRKVGALLLGALAAVAVPQQAAQPTQARQLAALPAPVRNAVLVQQLDIGAPVFHRGYDPVWVGYHRSSPYGRARGSVSKRRFRY